MTPSTEKKLRDAWHGPLTATAIVKRHRLAGQQRLNEFWSAEKRAGRLPDSPRPHFRHCTPQPLSAGERATGLAADTAAALLADGAAVDAAADLRLDREIAIAECRDDVGAIPSPDPLLAALERHHGNDRRRRLDDLFFPDDILRVPNAARLRGKRKFIDAAMTAVAKNPERYEAAFR